MEQLNFFGEAVQSSTLPPDLLDYRPAIFDSVESDQLLRSLIANTSWTQETIRMYGKMLQTPRLTAWYGDDGKSYTYSRNKHQPIAWTDELLMIRQKIEHTAGAAFNSVLLNYYRNGNDSMAWHSDDENELGKNPVIASVSFGQARCFDVRQRNDHQRKYAINLEHGSLLLMKGDLQHYWEHRIAKSNRPMRERVNLTFRMIR